MLSDTDTAMHVRTHMQAGIKGCSAARGGAMFATASSYVSLRSASSLANNRATSDGAAVYLSAAATLDVRDSTLANNLAVLNGVFPRKHVR